MMSCDADDVLQLQNRGGGDATRVSKLDETSLSVKFEDNMRKLINAHQMTRESCNRLCNTTLTDREAEMVNENVHAYSSDQEVLEDTYSVTSDTEIMPVFDRATKELLNKSVGTLQSMIAGRTKDQVRDFSMSDENLESPKICKGVRLNPLTCVRQYEMPSSEEDEVERYKEARSGMVHNNTRGSAMAVIEDMWDAFTVDKYAPWSSFRQNVKLQRSQSLTKVDVEKIRNPVKVWRKKVTVPKPPMMLQREANKTPKKTKAMIELDQQIEEKKRLEDLECKKQFRATPAPDHVHLRLFEEMSKRQDAKRRLVREHGEEILKSQQKPFEFLEREEKKQLEKQKERRQQRQRTADCLFRARPFPAHIFNGTVEDKILEEEEYRRIRAQMRAEELLNTSVAPYSMRVRDRMEKRSRDGHLQEEDHEEFSFHPKVNQRIPDADEQYQRFMENMIKSKEKTKPTTCEPFNLRQSKPKRYRNHNKELPSSSDLLSTPVRERVSSEASRAEELSPRQKQARPRQTKAEERQQKLSNRSDTQSEKTEERRKELDHRREKYNRNASWTDESVTASSDEQSENGANNKTPAKLNVTFDLDDDHDTSALRTSKKFDFWSHPSLVQRSQFWSNPVASLQ